MNADHKYHDASIRDIVWSPTAEMLATASGGTVTVLDGRNGERNFVQNYEVPVTGLAFFTGGLLFAAAAGNEITVWESDTWNETVRLETASPVTALRFCCSDEIVCNQPLLVCGSENGTVTVFDLKNRTRTTKSLHNRPVKAVAWMGFRHASVVSAGGGRIIESVFENSRCELTQANRLKAASDLLATPYQLSGGESLIRGDDKGYMYKNHRLDYAAIGASLVSANQGTLEYHLPQIGRLGKRSVGNSISSLSWLGNFPLNFVTGDRRGAITLWGIEIAQRSFLTRWLSKSTVSGAIFQPLVKIEGHQDTVTALAYPSVKRAFQNQLLASGCADGTVRLWDVNNDDLRERAAENAKPFIVAGSYAMMLNGTPPPNPDISVSPESVLRRTFDLGSKR